uniref:Uncharacterized protein n=1 Tax=Strigamia maritima TaxID=126957 RepID=T1IKK5_STRMM
MGNAIHLTSLMF